MLRERNTKRDWVLKKTAATAGSLHYYYSVKEQLPEYFPESVQRQEMEPNTEAAATVGTTVTTDMTKYVVKGDTLTVEVLWAIKH